MADDDNQVSEKEREDRRDEAVLPTDPISDGIVQLGTPLRDAAVDPRASDFLPPTHAGEAHPHSRMVVSPGLHAGGHGPIAPGPVSKDPAEQEAKETDLAEAVFVEGQDVPSATLDVPGAQVPEAPASRVPVRVEGEPQGASARAANGTSDTTPATRTVPAKKAAAPPTEK